MTVCSRFAPSPTGSLHVGSVRTALYAWLYAKKHQGKFILRIEDTDRVRSTQEAIQIIFDGMEWLDLDYEGPYYQTEHFDRYREVMQQLLASGDAYRCYCTKARLDDLRADQLANKEKPRYDGHCRDLKTPPQNQPYVVRFRTPIEGSVSFEDQVHGHVEVQNSELDDLVLLRSDGVPTYNFSVVIDDLDMGVTHVIRGNDHINNTPRQIHIFTALHAKPPQYAHLPMILGDDGKRLSKRHGAVSVLEFRNEGILPQALLNYLVRLGWSHGDQEIFSRDEMIELFDVANINKAAAGFDREKLLWLNQHYLQNSDPLLVVPDLQYQFTKLDLDLSFGPELAELIPVQASRCKTLREMAEKSRYFYAPVSKYDEEAVKKHMKPKLKQPLEMLCDELENLSTWTNETIHDVIQNVANKAELKFGKLAQPIRIAMTGGTISPSIDVTLRLIGKERVVKRFKAFLKNHKH